MNTSDENNRHNETSSMAACEPTPVADLRERLQVLRDSGVRAYKDAGLEIVFEPRKTESIEDAAMKSFLEAELKASQSHE